MSIPTQRFMTAKITNVEALRQALGKDEADYVIRRALKRIARDTGIHGGRVTKTSGTRVIAEFLNDAEAQKMALNVDGATNEIPVSKGMRIETAVFIADPLSAEEWQQSRFEEIIPRKIPDQAAPGNTRAIVRYQNRELVLGPNNTEATVGRNKTCSLVVDHSWVSRIHAKLIWDQGKVIIEDCSSNSSYILPKGGDRETRIWREKLTITRNSSIAFGMPLAISNGHPVLVEIEFS